MQMKLSLLILLLALSSFSSAFLNSAFAKRKHNKARKEDPPAEEPKADAKKDDGPNNISNKPTCPQDKDQE